MNQETEAPIDRYTAMLEKQAGRTCPVCHRDSMAQDLHHFGYWGNDRSSAGSHCKHCGVRSVKDVFPFICRSCPNCGSHASGLMVKIGANLIMCYACRWVWKVVRVEKRHSMFNDGSRGWDYWYQTDEELHALDRGRIPTWSHNSSGDAF